MKSSNYHKVILFMALIIFLFIYILSSFHFTFNMDEEFTMGLIKYNYVNLINIDSFDVHPPLYYLCLKLFLQIFTFWTSSIFVKVIFSRIFSLVIFSIAFWLFIKIAKEINIHIKTISWLLCYCFIPSVLFYGTTIRMYSLASLFIIYELFYLIKFNNNDRINYLVIFTIFGVLASYTHYYAAVSAVIFIAIFFVISLFKEKFKQSLRYCYSFILFIILYMPLLPFVTKQFKYESSTKSTDWQDFFHEVFASTVGVNNSNGLMRNLFIILCLFAFISLIIWSLINLSVKFNSLLLITITNYLITILVAFLSAFVNNTPFSSRYTYPIFSIYSFLLVVIFCEFIVSNFDKNKFSKIIIIILSMLFIINCGKATIKNIKMYDIPSFVLLNNFNSWKTSNNKDIDINHNMALTQYGKPLYFAQSAIYLNSIHKKAIVYTNNSKYMEKNLLGHKNNRLYYRIINNIVFIRK